MPLKLKPSEYFQRQCFVTCDPHDETLPLAIQGIGAERILFATDYPHFDSAGGAVKTFLSQEGIASADRQKLSGTTLPRSTASRRRRVSKPSTARSHQTPYRS
jgi:hypothetical protein